MHQLDLLGKQLVESITDEGMRLAATNFHQHPRTGDALGIYRPPASGRGADREIRQRTSSSLLLGFFRPELIRKPSHGFQVSQCLHGFFFIDPADGKSHMH